MLSYGFPAAGNKHPDAPHCGDDKAHWNAHGEDFSPHLGGAARLGKCREEGELPGEFSVYDVIHYKHNRATPEHGFQGFEGSRNGLTAEFTVCGGCDCLNKGRYKTSHS